MKMIAGWVQPDSGTIEIGQTVKIGYFSQENEAMDENLKVIDYIRNVAEYVQTKDGSISASQMLERFLFPGSVQYTTISRLSGGEKRRLYLLRILMDAPNVLLLDEPTNDLDIRTLTILEDYLDSFRALSSPYPMTGISSTAWCAGSLLLRAMEMWCSMKADLRIIRRRTR